MGGLTWLEIIYWIATIIGGTLFILRLGLMFVGGDLSDDALDAALDSGISDAEHAGGHADGDASFKLLSLQGLTAFFMIFGLAGLALLQANTHVAASIAGGTLAGLLAVWLIGLLFSQIKRLQSDGTINLQNAIGKDGTVYLTIRKNATGQVEVNVQGSLKIYDAVTRDKLELTTGEKVIVVGVAGNKTLIVEKNKI